MVLVKCVEWKGKFSESSEVGFVELWGGGIDRTDRSRFLGGGGEVLWAEKEAEVLEAVQFLERVKATIYGT